MEAIDIKSPDLFLSFSVRPYGSRPALPGFTPDHRRLIIPNENSDNVSIFNLESLSFERTIALAAGGRPWQAKSIPNQPELAYVSNSRFGTTASTSPSEPSTVSLINVIEGVVLKELPVGSGPNGVTVDRQSRFGYVVNMRSNDITVIDISLHKPIHRIPVAEAPAFAKLTLDGSDLVVTNLRSASVTIIETNGFTERAELQTGVANLCDTFPEWGPGDTTGIAITGDRTAYVTNYRSHSIVKIDLDSLEFTRFPSIIKFPFFVEVDREENLVVFSSGVEKRFAVLDHKTGQWLGSAASDGSEKLPKRLKTLNLWMTDPSNDRITAILPNGRVGILNWDRNMVTKLM